MIKTTQVLIWGLIFSLNICASAQGDFARIEKNRNTRAEGLYHDLNRTKDTLILRSDSKIGYVYSINRDYQREIDTYIFDYECKIPLSKLSKGKHVFAVGHLSMAIVFVVHRLEDKEANEILAAEINKNKINTTAKSLEASTVSAVSQKVQH